MRRQERQDSGGWGHRVGRDEVTPAGDCSESHRLSSIDQDPVGCFLVPGYGIGQRPVLTQLPAGCIPEVGGTTIVVNNFRLFPLEIYFQVVTQDGLVCPKDPGQHSDGGRALVDLPSRLHCDTRDGRVQYRMIQGKGSCVSEDDSVNGHAIGNMFQDPRIQWQEDIDMSRQRANWTVRCPEGYGI